MAYSIPPRWTHLETVTHTDLNVIDGDIDHIYGIQGDNVYNYAMPYNRAENVDHGVFFVHLYRWLHYRGELELVDPSGIGEGVTAGQVGATAVYDLESVEWLTVGKLYEVKDVEWAAEDVYA